MDKDREGTEVVKHEDVAQASGRGLQFSESVEHIAPALVQVQQKIEDPPRTGNNPHYGSRYVKLEDLIHAARPVLAEQGITLMQAPDSHDGEVIVETVFLHESGEWARHVARTPTQRNDVQGFGSATTYLRRYSLAAMLGLAHEDDDDAERAVEHEDPKGKKTKSRGPASDKQRNYIYALLKEREVPDEQEERIRAKVKTFTSKRASECIEYLEGLPEAGGEPEPGAAEANEDEPDKDEWGDRADVLMWFESTYGDEWEAKLNLFLSRHPDLSTPHEKLDKMAWNRISRFVDEHDREGVEDPRQVLQTEATL